MLPDFKITKSSIRERVTDFLEQRTQFHMGGFGSIGKKPIHEGSGFITEYDDGMVDDSDLSRMHSKVEFDPTELIKNPIIAFDKLEKIALDQAAKQAKMIVDKVNEVTEKTGNITDFRGTLTVDKIFEVFENMTIDFNSEGKPFMPSVFAGKELLESMKKVFEEIHNTPTLLNRLDNIIANQKQKWYDRAANRKLVD